MLVEIAREAGMRYLFGTALPELPGASILAPYGNALLSRYPFVNAATYRLPAPEGRESRGAIVAESECGDGRLLTFCVTHLDHRSEQVRSEQCEHTLRATAHLAGQPHVLMGDFNALAPRDYGSGGTTGRFQDKGAHLVAMQVIPRLLRAGYLDAGARCSRVPPRTLVHGEPDRPH